MQINIIRLEYVLKHFLLANNLTLMFRHYPNVLLIVCVAIWQAVPVILLKMAFAKFAALHYGLKFFISMKKKT